MGKDKDKRERCDMQDRGLYGKNRDERPREGYNDGEQSVGG